MNSFDSGRFPVVEMTPASGSLLYSLGEMQRRRKLSIIVMKGSYARNTFYAPHIFAQLAPCASLFGSSSDNQRWNLLRVMIETKADANSCSRRKSRTVDEDLVTKCNDLESNQVRLRPSLHSRLLSAYPVLSAHLPVRCPLQVLSDSEPTF